MLQNCGILLLLSAVLGAQTVPGTIATPEKDPAYKQLTDAFASLNAHDFDAAIRSFEAAAAASPQRPDIRKNLAYTLLKTGESDAAREQFGEAVWLDPADLHVALEYAFLCYEARDNAAARKAEARRIFARVRDSGDATTRATAATAFKNVDLPLESGIARWRQVLATTTPTFSAHYELAQLAEQRDELDLAAANYQAAFRLLPERKSVLLDLARVEKARSNPEGAMAALLAASRGGETRSAEMAREQLPDRYPYVYEFRKALELDPKNSTLHRELAWLLLSMSEKEPENRAAAVTEFRLIVDSSPDDYLAAAQLGLLYYADDQPEAAAPLFKEVLAHADAATANRVRMALKIPLVLEDRQAEEPALDPRVLGERSYQAGFLKDAKRYFLQANDQNPLDASVALKLGWTNNMLHDDAAALRWFDKASRSADSAIADEAHRAWSNLHPALETFRTTVWLSPLASSRWSDIFAYGQMKTEMKLNKTPWLRPYASIRLAGDARRTTTAGTIPAQSLSESALIFGAGVATQSWRGAMAWFEAGSMMSYLNGGRSRDYRGGISYSRTYGSSMAAEYPGWFIETLADSVFVSRFGNDLVNYSQNRAGYTSQAGPVRVQTFLAGNISFDVKKQYWANTVEVGPGFRFHPPGAPAAVSITLSAIHGVYLRNEGNPRRPNFNDLRAGVWYAFTK